MSTIKGTDGALFVNGERLGSVKSWSMSADVTADMRRRYTAAELASFGKSYTATDWFVIDEYPRIVAAAERGSKHVSKSKRIKALEREVRTLMAQCSALQEHVNTGRDTARVQFNQINSLQNEISKLSRADASLGEQLTNHKNSTLLDKRQAERQLQAVQVQLAGLKEWAAATDNEDRSDADAIEELKQEQVMLWNKVRTIEDLQAQIESLRNQATLPRLDASELIAQHTQQIDDLYNRLRAFRAVVSERISGLKCQVSAEDFNNLKADIGRDVSYLEQQMQQLQHQAKVTAESVAQLSSLERGNTIDIDRLERSTVEQLAEKVAALTRLSEMDDQHFARLHADIERIEQIMQPYKQATEQLATLAEKIAGLTRLSEYHDRRILKFNDDIKRIDQNVSEHDTQIERMLATGDRVEQLAEKLAAQLTQLAQVSPSLMARLERVERILDTMKATAAPQAQLYQYNQETGIFTAIDPPVWYGGLPTLLHSLRNEIDATIADFTQSIVAQYGKVIADVQTLQLQMGNSVAIDKGASENIQMLIKRAEKIERDITLLRATAHTHYMD